MFNKTIFIRRVIATCKVGFLHNTVGIALALSALIDLQCKDNVEINFYIDAVKIPIRRTMHRTRRNIDIGLACHRKIILLRHVITFDSGVA